VILRDGTGWVLRDGKVQSALPAEYVAEIERMKARIVSLEQQLELAEFSAKLNQQTIREMHGR
jgi:hypothetical protein